MERRRRGLGVEWHAAKTTRFGSASSRPKHHCQCKARLFLMLSRRLDAVFSSERFQAMERVWPGKVDRAFYGRCSDQQNMFLHEIVADFLERDPLRFDLLNSLLNASRAEIVAL